MSTKTGLILNEPNEEYHSNDAVSSSKLAEMRIAGKYCPLNYYLRHITKAVKRKKGNHFDIGIATHLLILEGPEAFHAACVVEPETYRNEKGEVKPWSGNAKACKDWAEAQKGKIVLNKEEAELIGALDMAISQNPEAKRLTTAGTAEVTFRKFFNGLNYAVTETRIAENGEEIEVPTGEIIKLPALFLQCRTDRWIPDEGPNGTIVDLKTCNTIEQFEREFYFLRYNFRAEFYRLVISEVLADIAEKKAEEIEAPDYLFVVVEKSAPYRVKIFKPDGEALDIGRKEVHADLKTLRFCMATGQWPSGTEGIHSIGLTTWQLAKSNDASDAALS